ncbi:glycyl radical enzyme domain-containing protein, partial [Escherichia coli]|uniref:glycyl radical enzyme domain-containing protein n=1 Tax=Escherichia coli TaxID=562 RepID=UPI0011158E2C
LCLGAFTARMRAFTATVSGNALVRVTGYMVRLSALEKSRTAGSRTPTTCLVEAAARNPRLLEPPPLVLSHTQLMRFRPHDYPLLLRFQPTYSSRSVIQKL